MPRYSYKARDPRDRVVTGIIEGISSDEALDRLAQKELTPIIFEELRFDGTIKGQTFMDKLNESLLRMQTRVSYKDVVFFTRQLATMVAGGVSIARALTRLAENEKPVFKKILLSVGEDISAGYTFADAIAKHPGAFNSMYIAVAHSGEIAGALDRVLDELATYMESMEAMRAKVKGAMRYPSFVLGFVTLLVIGIMWKLVPIFSNMYAGMGAQLPMPTQILVTISDLIVHNILIVLFLGIAAVVGLKVAIAKDDRVKLLIHKLLLGIPVFGLILKKNIWALFSRTMALLLECGIPILQATEIAGAVVGNLVYSNSLQDVYNNLRKGDMLSTALDKTKIFPVLVSQLVSTGEESGKVDALLRKAAEFYEREIRVTVDSLASIIEPFLIILLGGIVGSILIALYLPIFNVGKLMGG